MGGKTRNVAFQLVLQQSCKLGYRFLVARFSVKHESLRICEGPTLHEITATTHLYARSIKGLLFAHFLIGSVIGSYLEKLARNGFQNFLKFKVDGLMAQLLFCFTL